MAKKKKGEKRGARSNLDVFIRVESPQQTRLVLVSDDHLACFQVPTDTYCADIGEVDMISRMILLWLGELRDHIRMGGIDYGYVFGAELYDMSSKKIRGWSTRKLVPYFPDGKKT